MRCQHKLVGVMKFTLSVLLKKKKKNSLENKISMLNLLIRNYSTFRVFHIILSLTLSLEYRTLPFLLPEIHLIPLLCC